MVYSLIHKYSLKVISIVSLFVYLFHMHFNLSCISIILLIEMKV